MDTPISADYTKNHNCTIADIGNELIVYDTISAGVHVLNETAKLIWNACDRGHTVEELATAVAVDYHNVRYEDALSQITDTLQLFVSLGLLTVPATSVTSGRQPHDANDVTTRTATLD